VEDLCFVFLGEGGEVAEDQNKNRIQTKDQRKRKRRRTKIADSSLELQ
jgi:hypothetical protein